MNDLIKYGLLGVAGYFVYQHFTSTAAAAATTPAPAASALPSMLSAYGQQLYTLAASDPQFTSSAGQPTGTMNQWNYYILRLGLPTSIAGTDPGSAAFAGLDWSQTFTFQQVWTGLSSYLQSKGLSGLRGRHGR
jgi:hypothetical protein